VHSGGVIGVAAGSGARRVLSLCGYVCSIRAAFRSRGAPVEYHVRSTRLTDIDAAVRILMRDAADPDRRRQDADRLRNLLFVPSASVVVAEADRRVIGIGVLSIRPSVRSGPFIGVIDELGVDPEGGRSGSAAPVADAAQRSRIGVSLLEQLVVSARNKGSTRVDVTDPLATAEPALLKSVGFARRGALLSRATG
jgi:ribosomal protein S18 acetylase RimI-like enzyme